MPGLDRRSTENQRLERGRIHGRIRLDVGTPSHALLRVLSCATRRNGRSSTTLTALPMPQLAFVIGG